MPNNDTPISSFQDATEINSADKLTGLQNNVNRNFSFSTILSWFVQTVAAAFVPVGRKVNNKALSADIMLDASDVGAQGTITASGILKGDGAGGVSAAVAGTDYGTYSKPSGGIPSSDMTSAVQTSLGKADSAYQKPSGGIPASDLANGVIPSVPSPSDSTPQALGTAAAGSSGNYSRADHVHQKPTYSKSDVGLGNVANELQYSANNPPPYPVISVNGNTGAVTVSVPSAYASNPEMDGTASPGSSGSWAKGDHVHPSDTTKANQEQLAYVESGTTASRAYAIGEYFCMGGSLYRAKTAISSGASFTVGTNCEPALAMLFRTGKWTPVNASVPSGAPGRNNFIRIGGLVIINVCVNLGSQLSNMASVTILSDVSSTIGGDIVPSELTVVPAVGVLGNSADLVCRLSFNNNALAIENRSGSAITTQRVLYGQLILGII